MNGFFDKLIEFVDGAVQEGFIKEQNRNSFVSSSDPIDLIERLKVIFPLNLLRSLKLTIERITQIALSIDFFAITQTAEVPRPIIDASKWSPKA